ncbi:MAG: sigma-E processing peptidase SpoIIGA [Bacteroidota bacterium]
MRELILDPYLRNALYDLFMDGTLLWVTGAIAKETRRWYRLLGGAAIGGSYTLWLALARDGVLIGGTILDRPLVFFGVHMLLLPALMLAVAFLPTRRRGFLHLGGIFVLVALLTYGTANIVFYFFATFIHRASRLLYISLQAGLALTIGELGWGVVHERAMAKVCQVPLTLDLGPARLETEGLLDTGNQLCDPVSRKPVVVLDYSLVKGILSDPARAFIEALAEGGSPPELPAEDPWFPRMRVIPYRTIQNNAGLMPGIRADRIWVGRDDRGLCHTSVIVGLEMAGGLNASCPALVPPVLWPFNPSVAREQGRE